jgi:hypothetical protein
MSRLFFYKIFCSVLGRHQEFLISHLGRGRLGGDESQLEVDDDPFDQAMS